MKKLGIIINPIAGSGSGNRLLKHLVQGLKGTDFEPIIKATTKRGDAEVIARKTSQFDALACIGGDGTINEIINGLSKIGFRIPLGIIPVGSGNVIAKELKLCNNIKRFIALLEKQQTKLLDVGEVILENRSVLFISMAGIGFDAEVTRRHHLKRKGADFHPHTTSYLPIGLKTALRYKVPKIRLEIDDKLITEEASFIQVANARSYGGSFVFACDARPDDGILDIVWFKSTSSRNILRYYFDAFRRNLSGRTSGTCLKGKKIRLESRNSVPVQVDGDFCGYLPVKIRVIPRSVSVFCEPQISQI